MNFFLNQGMGHGNSGVEHAQFYRAQCFLDRQLPFKIVFTDLLQDLHIHMREWHLPENQVIGLYDFLLAADPLDYLDNGLPADEVQNSHEKILIDQTDTQRIITTQSSGNYQIRRLRDKIFNTEKNIYIVDDAHVSLTKGAHQVEWSYRQGPGEKIMQDIHLTNFLGENYYFLTFDELVTFFLDQLAAHFGQNTYFVDRGTFYDETLVRQKAAGSKQKIVGMVHANHKVSEENGHILFNNFYQYTLDHLDQYDAVVVATKAQKAGLKADLQGYTAEKNLDKIYAIPVGGVTKLGQAKTRKNQKLNLVTASRLHEEKHIDQIIDAVQVLVERGHDVNLTIYGAGAEDQKLAKQIKELGLTNRVVLAGLSQHVTKDLQRHDVFVSASYSEGFGLTYLEALSQGLPVASYANNFGAKELIHPGENGYLADFLTTDAERKNNVAQLADAILSCFQDYDRLSAGAIASCRPFLTENVAEKWAQLEDELS
ncbi:glycosyltransferase [Fructobacillus tropaeoli]|uniref:glycosyltransferase n=1 Tax=Fructobacillus tropaeoli TaxID=709323 RepID=UPI0014561352|nr:glycosyltransferase [Fructobacillus tropaeoli]NLS38014.1 glycosyltransferase [Fructobacillus tropaeoli]